MNSSESYKGKTCPLSAALLFHAIFTQAKPLATKGPSALPTEGCGYGPTRIQAYLTTEIWPLGSQTSARTCCKLTPSFLYFCFLPAVPE